MADQQAVGLNFGFKNSIMNNGIMMDNSINLPLKKKLKRLKHQGNLSTIHNASFNRSLNRSVNSSRLKQNLREIRDKNRLLAKTLESVRKDLKWEKDKRIETMRDNQELTERVKLLERVCGLKNDQIEEEVNRRLPGRMAEVKDMILKASQGLQSIVPFLQKGLVICSDTGRHSSIGSCIISDSGSQSTASAQHIQNNTTTDRSSVSQASRRSIFGMASTTETQNNVRPVRSAIPSGTAPVISESRSESTSSVPLNVVRPSDFYNNDLSMIMEQSHLDDLDLDDLDGIGFGRRSSRQRLSRKTKSRGRRSAIQASRSLEMFQKSLAENTTQEELPSTSTEAENKTETVKEETEKEKQMRNEAREKDAIRDVIVLVEKIDNPENTTEPDSNDDKNTKSLTRSRSVKRAQSSARETRSKSKARKRTTSSDSESEEHDQPTSRMSRRDSYELTMKRKSRESSRETDKVNVSKDSENLHESHRSPKKPPPPRRKSRRNKTVETDERENGSVADGQSADSQSIPEDQSREKSLSRRKSKRLLECRESSSEKRGDSDSESQENSIKQAIKKSKRSIRVSHVDDKNIDTDRNEKTIIIDHESPKKLEEAEKPGLIPESSVSDVSKSRKERESKRKSRRATKALFTAADIEEFKTNTDETEKNAKTTQNETVRESQPIQEPKTAKQQKDRRGTFVVNIDQLETPEASNPRRLEENKNLDSKKDRRGTFVVPTAPPPAPRSKKTISNIPILENKAKHPYVKETGKKSSDRRGTYFVAKPVTPYLEVENIDDIQADSLLVSLTDDDSQSESRSGEISTEKKSPEEVQETKHRSPAKTHSREVSPTPQPGEATVLEPQDMELTEALTFSINRFRAPEPHFLRKVSPGPVTASKMSTGCNESKVGTDKNGKDSSAIQVHVDETDLEDEVDKDSCPIIDQKVSKEKESTLKESVKDAKDQAVKNSLMHVQSEELISDSDDGTKVTKKEVKERRSKKFKLLKTADDTLGPSDSDAASETISSQSDSPPKENQQRHGRRSRRSAKIVKYTETDSDQEESTQSENEKEEEVGDSSKSRSKQKFQAWLSKPGDIKYTGGKRDISAELVEDLTKHRRSKSKDRSTIIPKPRGRSRSRSRSKPRIPLPSDDSPKSEFDFVSTPPQDRLTLANGSQSAKGKSSSPGNGRMSYSEFRGRTPVRKSMGSLPQISPKTYTVPLEPKKTNCPEEDELTINDHGIMLLLGNGRRTKPRTKGKKGKSVCMAPEKSELHLITPMVDKTQSMPRTPPPHGSSCSAEASTAPIKSPPPPLSSASADDKELSSVNEPLRVPPKSKIDTVREPIVSIPESPMVSPDPKVSKPPVSTAVSNVSKRTKSPEKYFGFEIDDDDSVFKTEPESSMSRYEEKDSVSSKNSKKETIAPRRKTLMERKPIEVQKESTSLTANSKAEEDKVTDQVATKRVNRSRSRTRKSDKENEDTLNSSHSDVQECKTPALKAAKTPAPSKSVRSAKARSTKKSTKTPGTAKKAGTLTNLKRRLQGIKSKSTAADEDQESPVEKKCKANRRLYDDDDEEDNVELKMDTTSGQKRRSSEMQKSSGFVVYEDKSPKRPRRAAAKPISYVEPSVGSKLRQGDPGTSSFFNLEDLKWKKQKDPPKKRDALHTVTNIKV